jgi:hypothetical protein
MSVSSLPISLTATPPEVSLLLRAHAEQRWLSREVVPVVRQLETRDGLPEEQVGAALAYLEVVWGEASRRAGDTDGACTQLDLLAPIATDCALATRARRYRAAVVALRDAALRRVAPLLAVPDFAGDGLEGALGAYADGASADGISADGAYADGAGTEGARESLESEDPSRCSNW